MSFEDDQYAESRPSYDQYVRRRRPAAAPVVEAAPPTSVTVMPSIPPAFLDDADAPRETPLDDIAAEKAAPRQPRYPADFAAFLLTLPATTARKLILMDFVTLDSLLQADVSRLTSPTGALTDGQAQDLARRIANHKAAL